MESTEMEKFRKTLQEGIEVKFYSNRQQNILKL